MNILDEISADLSLTAPEPETPELGFYEYLTNTKSHPRIYNCQYWLKHELFVYRSLKDKNYITTKPNGLQRLQITNKELARALLEYYFLMVFGTKFHGERHTERDKLVNMDQFLDLVMEHPVIKKLIENPETLI